MKLEPLPFDAEAALYLKQAAALLEAYRAGDPVAIRYIQQRHSKFTDTEADAQLVLARWYEFRDWPALTQYTEAASQQGSPTWIFESASEAVINGDATALDAMLRDYPELVRARSSRIMSFDPPAHRATLLHYVAANGVEGYRQRTPKNAVDIAKTLLRSGSDPDALADMYGGKCTTLSMLVSSCHPHEAGLQSQLAETLLDFGASVEALGEGNWTSPLMTALAFGYQETAQTLVRRGARVDNIAAAAGLGRLDDAKRMLSSADALSRQRALALAAQHGQVDVVRLLLDAGEDPNQYNPEGNHSHSTPLHQAVWSEHLDVVRLLIERSASLTMRDKAFDGTPLDWALHGKKTAMEDYLRSQGAKTSTELDNQSD